MRLYAGVDTDGRVKLFTMESGIPRIVTHGQWLDITHEIEGYVPGEMLTVELSQEERLKPPRIQVRGVTVSYPDWQFPGKHQPDPARFDHADVTLQIFGTPLDLRHILGLRQFDDLVRATPHRPRIFDISPDERLCPGNDGETVLDRLCVLGYMTNAHRKEIERFMKSQGQQET